MISIHAISTGKIQDLPYSSKRPIRSALDKTKISQTTWLSSTGFTGDEQAYKDHGGPHKAVCGFSKHNYALYQDDLPTLPTHAMFGENLTFDYLDESDVYFGNQYLGETFKLPVEVDKFNWYHILRKIESYADIKVERRVNEDVAFITDNGNYILDCKLPKGIDPYKFHEYLIHLTGVFETGYFLDMADQVIVGTQEGVKILEK
ncbi:hypothetical protein APW54_05375 [Staphylococcus aureus]|nr:ribose-5-phosphate isomerase A [Staphylococcus aureus]PAI26507.1 hypothetical protein APW54_05375 [Staphylococcus aureus]